MGTSTILTASGIDTDFFFPGLRGGGFTVLVTATDAFRIQYASDGNPGGGLVVEFVSTANNFTYAGNTPTGGTFQSINVYASDGVTLLGTFAGDVAQSLTSFANTNLAVALINGTLTNTGNAGDDILHSYEGETLFVGNDGNDTFVIDGSDLLISNSQFHGSASNGTGGAGETNEIILRTNNAQVLLNTAQISNIDALTFDTAGINSQFRFTGVLPGDGRLSSTTTVTGDGSQNVLFFSSSSGLDLSGFVLNNWTAGVDRVEINTNNAAGTYIGSSGDDFFYSVRNGAVVAGGTGNDIFEINTAASLPSAIHGSGVDGSGGGGETDLIGINARLDATALFAGASITNIDGFYWFYTGSVSFDGITGAVTGGARDLTLDNSEIATLFPTGLVLSAANGVQAGIRVILDSPSGNTFDATAWDASGLSSAVLHITGSAGNDIVTGWNFANYVVLGGGADTVTLGSAADQVFFDETAAGGALDGGGGANDRLVIDYTDDTAGLTFALLDPGLQSIGPGGMTVTGFEEISFFGGSGADVITGGSGTAQIFGQGGDDVLTAGGGLYILHGGQGGDTLTGGAMAGSLYGEDGDDTVISGIGGSGSVLDGGGGTDLLVIDRSDLAIALDFDVLSNGSLIDGTSIAAFEHVDFTSGSGNDNISGGDLDDIIRGGAGRDELTGRGGIDHLFGDDGIDILDGGAGDDLLDGGDGFDTLDGGSGDDQLFGDAGFDELDGGAGNDLLDGGTGYDTMVGGAGDDTYVVDEYADITFELAGEGTDTTRSFIDHTLADNIENLVLLGGAISGTGNALDNTLTGNALANVLDGAGGSDTVDYGGTTLGVSVNLGSSVGTGSQTGTDQLLSIENAIGGSGNDTIFGSAVANVLSGGAGNDTLAGLAGNDVLIGGDGEDALAGGTEDDHLIGGAGDDTLFGNSGNDLIEGGAGDDYTNGGDGDDIINGGADDDNVLVGGGGNDTIHGDDGSDGISGSAGNDMLYGDGGNDRIYGGFGLDQMWGGADDDTMGGLGDNDQMWGGTGSDGMNGGGGDDQMFGEAGNDRLYGGLGADTLNGGADDDLLVGQGGLDTFVFEANWGHDQISGYGLDVTGQPFVDEVIDMSALGISFADLTIEQSGVHTLVYVTADGSATNSIEILFRNVADITASDFVF